MDVAKMRRSLERAAVSARVQSHRAARRRGAHCAECEHAPEWVRSLHRFAEALASPVQPPRVVATLADGRQVTGRLASARITGD